MVLRQSSKVSTLSAPPQDIEDPGLANWVRSAYTTITQLSHAVQRIQGNLSANQPTQETGSNPGGTQTEININALRPDGVIIVVDGTIYPLSVEGVNAALAKASSKGGGTVMVPAGANIPVYTTSVKIPNRCCLQGFGSFSEVATFVGNAQTNVTAMVENKDQDGTQQYCAIRNIQVNGAKGTGAVVGAGILYKNGCYYGSLIEDSLVISCSGNGISIDGGDTHGAGSLDVRNTGASACDDHNILVSGKVPDGVRFYSINSEHAAAGKACLKIDRATSGTASANHSINGFFAEGLNAADTIVLNEVSAVTIIDAFYDGANHNSVIKVTGTVGSADGAFGSSAHLFLNIRGNIATIIDDQSSGVTVGTSTGSRFVSMYKSPVATAQSSYNTEQMYGIQPQRQGPTTASAATVNLVDGSMFPISGTTQLENFVNAARFKGKLMVTHHTGAQNIAHNSGGTGNLRLADGGDFAAAADSRVLWYSDGTNWWEVGRASAAASTGIYLRRDGGNTVTGTINFNNFSISNWRGASSSNSAQIDIISNKTAAAGAGINLRWNAAAAVAAGYYPLTVQYDNATGTRDVMKVGYQSTTESVLWLPDKDGGNDAGITECHIVAGDSNDYLGTGTSALRFIPNSFSGALWIYVGGELAMDIRRSTRDINITALYLLNNTGQFRFRAESGITNFDSFGSYQFGYFGTNTPSSGIQTAWLRGLPSSAAGNTDYSSHIASLDYLGQFRSGQHGDAAQAPADGGFSAAGWYEASTSTNQTGADVYIRAGRGTGDSPTKGDVIFQTPDVGASGTAVQSLTTKMSLSRIGDLALKAGTSSGTISQVGGTAYLSTTQTGNTAATETNLFSTATAANILDENGDGLHFMAGGTIAATVAVDKRIRVYYGGTTLLDTGALAITAGADWVIEGWVIRTGATTQKAVVSIQTSDAALVSTVNYSAPGETLSGAVTLRVTGIGTNASDVVGEMWKIAWTAAP